MSELSIEQGWRERSTLTSAQLPHGSESGGVLIEQDGRLLFVLFADEELEAGERVVIAGGLALTVAGVKHGTLSGQRVTVLDMGPSVPED